MWRPEAPPSAGLKIRLMTGGWEGLARRFGPDRFSGRGRESRVCPFAGSAQGLVPDRSGSCGHVLSKNTCVCSDKLRYKNQFCIGNMGNYSGLYVLKSHLVG